MADRRPTAGDIVVYRNKSGVDMPAIISQVRDDEAVHIHPFPPPGEAADWMSAQWGVQQHNPVSELDPAPQTWRWRSTPKPHRS